MAYNCKKCGKLICYKNEESKLQAEYFSYCDKCTEEFNNAINKGAIIIRRRIGQEDHIFRWDIYQGNNIHKNLGVDCPESMNQVQAIKTGKKLGEKYGVPVLFKYEPHSSMWFLEDYLEAHPKIKTEVEKPSFFSRIFRKNKLANLIEGKT